MDSPEKTGDLARRIGADLAGGDCVLLDGSIGAGKSHFSRHLIRSLLETPEDIPSPTFTLIQTYDTTAGELWHTDLYRLSSLEDVDELGLFEAFDDAICLVEWPDRLQDLAPDHALHIKFAHDPECPDTRCLTLSWSDQKWTPRMEKISHA